MARGSHGDDTLAGLGWFLVIVAMAIGAYLIFMRGQGPQPDPFAGGLEVELRADVTAARAAGRADDWEDDPQLLRQTAEVIEGRVTRLGIEPVRATVTNPDRIRVRLPALVSELTPQLKAALTGADDSAARDGVMAFRLVVEPDQWTREKPSFDAFKDAEVLRWQQAQVDGVAYTPGLIGFSVVPRRGTDATEAWHFTVVRDAASPTELFFGSAMLERPTVETAAAGRQRMRFRIKAHLRERFREFTETNRNRRLAVLVEGELVMAPVIAEQIDGAVDVTLDRPMSREEALRLAEAWVGPGPMRVRCFYVGETRLP